MPSKRVPLASVRAAVIALFTALCLTNAPSLHAQSNGADWEKAAGGKMSFDVASVKRSKPSVPWSADKYPGDGSLYSANAPLMYYVAFAYKLRGYTLDSLMSQLPKWVTQDMFEVQARAASTSTEDQMRLMMQSLLADRFKLAAHWEKRKAPSYNLILAKPGKIGSELQPHDNKIPCQPDKPATSGYGYIPGQLPGFCGRIVGGAGPRGVSLAGRNITMAQLADAMSGDFGGRAVVFIDKTGLTGGFDVNLSLRFNLTPEELNQFGARDIQAGYTEAFRDQLGIKLEPGTALADALVIDHVEEPSPN